MRDPIRDVYREVVAGIAAGDRAAFTVLYDDFFGAVSALAHRTLVEPADAVPVAEAVFVEAVFVEAWHLAASHHGSDRSVLGWLLAITARRCGERNRVRASADMCVFGLADGDYRMWSEIMDLLLPRTPTGRRSGDRVRAEI